MDVSQAEINQKLLNFANTLKTEFIKMQKEIQTLRREVKELSDSNEQLLAEVGDLRDESILQREIIEALTLKYKSAINLLPLEPDTRTEEQKLEDDIKANVVLIQNCIQCKEYSAIQELTSNWEEGFKKAVWERLTPKEKQQIRNLKVVYDDFEKKAKEALEDIFGDVNFQNVGSTGFDKFDPTKPFTAEEKQPANSNLIDFNKLNKKSKTTNNSSNPWGKLSFSTATEAIDGGL